MKKVKYFSILMLLAVLTLTGCSFGSKTLTTEERLEKALNNLSAADSFTAKMSIAAKASGKDVDVDMTVKAEKAKKGYNLYLGADVEADDEEISLEGYVSTNKNSLEIYFNMEDYMDEWAHIKFDLDDLEDLGLELDTDDIDLSDIGDEKVDMKIFKKIKEGKTKKGLTEIKAKIDTDDLKDEYGIELPEKMEVIFYVDSDNNLAKVEFDASELAEEYNLDKLEISIEISKVNKTKVKVPDDVKDDAEDYDLTELLTSMLTGTGNITNPISNPTTTPTTGSDSYSTEEIYYDVMLSSGIKSCDHEFVVDFKNYNNELYLYDDEYDVKRITEGEIKFSNADGSCKYEVIKPLVIDGKTCRAKEGTTYDGICE